MQLLAVNLFVVTKDAKNFKISSVSTREFKHFFPTLEKQVSLVSFQGAPEMGAGKAVFYMVRLAEGETVLWAGRGLMGGSNYLEPSCYIQSFTSSTVA